MKKKILITLATLLGILFISPILVFIIWMNLTPGHFESGNCGGYTYVEDSYKSNSTYMDSPLCPAVAPSPEDLIINYIIFFYSNFDLNR